MPADDLAQFMQEYLLSVGAFIKGDPEPQKRLWSQRDDITIANPLGPTVRGWQQVEAVMDHAASLIREGEILESDHIVEVQTPELAYIVGVERTRLKAGDADGFALTSLRVTTIFRREEAGWRIVHRHADATTTPRSITSVVET